MNRRPSKSRTGYDSFSPGRTARFTASTPDTRFFEMQKKKPVFARASFWFLVVLFLVLCINFAVNQFVHVARVEVPVKGLKESFDGFTLLHISDLKGASFGGNQGLLSFALGDSEYDAVVITGDMVSSLGNAQPFYALVERLRALHSDIPIYFIPGDGDPTPTSMEYATGGSPFAPWVLGAQQRGAELLSSPLSIQRGEDTLWLTTPAHLNLALDTMQQQFEQQYLRAQASGDSNELDLAVYNLKWLEETRAARRAITDEHIVVTLSHAQPSRTELSTDSSLIGHIDLLLCGHYLGGLLRLPAVGPLFIPSQNLPRYGLLPGRTTFCGLHRKGTTSIYNSPGLGSAQDDYPPFFFRLFNPPTVTLLSLTPSAL